MRSEYAQIVVLCRSFWLQSMKTRPPRSDFAMFTVVRFGSRATSICPSASAKFLVSSSVTDAPLSGTEMCRPLPPDVFTTAIRAEMVEQLAERDRDAAAVEHVGRRAGIEVEHDRARTVHVGQAATGSCAARARRGSASHTSVGRSSTMQLRWPPLGSSGSDTRTQFGWWGGHRFSKKRSPCSPSGARTSVGGRWSRWGSITGAMRR